LGRLDRQWGRWIGRNLFSTQSSSALTSRF
jgi:hypothetical protein